MSPRQPLSVEDRWRRSLEQRRRPLNLKAARLFEEFGHADMQPGAGEEIEARLARVGLQVRPSLEDLKPDDDVTLAMAETAAEPGAAAAAAEEAPRRAEQPPAKQPPAEPRTAATRRPRPTQAEPPPAAPPLDAPAAPPAAAPPAAAPPAAAPPAAAPRGAAPRPVRSELEDVEQSTLVQAALEAERRVRNAYDRAAAASAERVAALERELAAERAATARARDERDELERRMHGERRAAAARQQALAAAERTARGLLEAQRAQLSNLTQALRVSTAAIAQTHETLDEVHGQIQQTAADVRAVLTESTFDDAEIEPVALEPPPPAEPAAEPAPQQSAEIVLDAPSVDDPSFDEPEAGEVLPEPEPEPDADTGDEQALDEPAEQQTGEWDPPADLEGPSRPPRRHESEEPPPKRGLGFARRRRRVSLACAVCGRSGKAREPQQLVDAGWLVEGEVALCLTCLADDWTLAEGDTAPARIRT